MRNPPRSRLMAMLAPRIFCLMLPLIALYASFGQPEPAHAQAPPAMTPPCLSEISGEGSTNIFYPDTNSTYWALQVDSSVWQQLLITGQYPSARFFSFTTYDGSHAVVAGNVDNQINPDPGSVNPYQPPAALQSASNGTNSYTVTINADTAGSGNHIPWASGQTTYVVYRLYVPDEGLDREGGVPLPSFTLTGADGQPYSVPECTSDQTDSFRGLPSQEPSQAADVGTCPVDPAPPLQEITFSPQQGGTVFPNPATTYLAAQDLCLGPDQVLVIRGQALDFPDTYSGGSIFTPAFPGSIQRRYWSLCTNKQVPPRPVVACAADYATTLDRQEHYTYVVSNGSTPPSRLPRGVTWLPLGDATTPSILLFRAMLPHDPIDESYVPVGVTCSRQELVTQGWRHCFTDAGVTPP